MLTCAENGMPCFGGGGGGGGSVKGGGGGGISSGITTHGLV